MRTLFASEERCIRNLFHLRWQRDLRFTLDVITEIILEPATSEAKPWFNCDFILDFVDSRTFASDRASAVCSVLPNALGAELFLIVAKSTLRLTALELNGGTAFPIEDYQEYIDGVESAIESAMESV